MRRGFGSVGVVLAALSLTQGCDGGPVQPIPLDQFDLQVIAAICHKTFTCCDATERATLGPQVTDEASCRASYQASAADNLARYRALIDAGLSVYDGAAARHCVDQITALSCAEWGGDLSLGRYPNCSRVIVGTQAPGTVCASNNECAGNYCGSNGTSAPPTCAAPVNRGESCEFAPCAYGLACIAGSSGGPRTCGSTLPNGSSCVVDNQCASTFCITDGSTGVMACGVSTLCDGI